MNSKFTDLQLEPRLNSAIEKLGYQEMTPIQAAVIPHVMAGRDVSGLAQTGTGKTAAFLIPLMDRILKNQIADWKAPQFVLILVPTRELAEQVYENVVKLSEFSGLRGVSIYGGTSYEKQKEGLRNQVEFVVATPGRLIDLYKEHFVDLKQVRAIVFDEADRMFDMGFKDDMKYILQRVPNDRQFLVFSATLNFDVLNTAYQFGADPIEVNVSRDQARAENVKDEIFHVGQDDKPMYLVTLLKKYNPKQTIIFSNFKNNVERVSQYLSQNGLPAMAISSLLTQAQRNRVLELFKAENEKNILVATDVAARGLDIKGVDMVINFELPQDAESYVHRIGRTGRAGAEGRAFSLVSDRDVESLGRIEEYLKHKLVTGWIEDTEFIRDLKPFLSEDSHRRRPPQKSGGYEVRRDRPQQGRPQQRRENGPGDRSQPRRNQRSGPQQKRPHDRAENTGAGPAKARIAGDGAAQKSAENQNGQQNRRPDRRPPRTNGERPQRPQSDQRRPLSANANRRGKPRIGVSHSGASKQASAKAAGPKSTMQKMAGFFKKILSK